MLIVYLIFRKVLNRFLGYFLKIGLLSLLIGIVWDFIAINFGVWYFPAETNLGLIIFGIPIEEFLFFSLISVWMSMLTVIASRYKK